jgi:arylamine N-acetyltransferase
MAKFICECCKKEFSRNIRIKEDSKHPQRYCSAKRCQQSRKNTWEREKKDKDPDYKKKRENRYKEKAARQKRSEYQKDYRSGNPDYTSRNVALQRARNAKRVRQKKAVKPDALMSISEGRILSNDVSNSDYFVVYPLRYQELSKIVKPDALAMEQIDYEYLRAIVPAICKRL